MVAFTKKFYVDLEDPSKTRRFQCGKRDTRTATPNSTSTSFSPTPSMIIALTELNPDVIGFAGFDSAYSNCTVKTAIVEVDLFEGGDAFARFAESTRLNCTCAPIPIIALICAFAYHLLMLPQRE